MGHQEKCPFDAGVFARRLGVEGVGRTSLHMERLLSDGDERHLKSPASASSASEPISSQLIHFIAVR